MQPNTVDELLGLIRARHGVCDFLHAVHVSKSHKNHVLWSGDVGVFRLRDSGQKCYGWIDDSILGLREPVVLLKDGPIDSPTAAVTAHILSLCTSD
jgi:hypothetical protein